MFLMMSVEIESFFPVPCINLLASSDFMAVSKMLIVTIKS